LNNITLREFVGNNKVDEEKLIDIFLQLCDIIKKENRVITPDNVIIENGKATIDKNTESCDNGIYHLGCCMDEIFGAAYNGRMRVVIEKCKNNGYKNVSGLKFSIFFNRYKSIIIIAIWVCVVALIAKYKYMG
jgi:hypothetical protein